MSVTWITTRSDVAEAEGGHTHRFRDTFAVQLTLAGVPFERVSGLLGHQGTPIMEDAALAEDLKNREPSVHAYREGSFSHFHFLCKQYPGLSTR